MSRHTYVKNMNLDDQLDDYGEDEEYDEEGAVEEELSPEDKEQMILGTVKVRSVLGDSPVSDKEIRDSLWHYYYDVEKTIAYLLNSKTPKESKKGKKGATSAPTKTSDSTMPDELPLPPVECPKRYTAADFFQGISWFNVPESRRANITIEPLYPRGGLLGGNPDGGAPKVSKLAALAASRKRKENEPKAGSSASSSVALLDKLGHKKASNEACSTSTSSLKNEDEVKEKKLSKTTANLPTRSYAGRRRRSPTPPRDQLKPESLVEKETEEIVKPEQISSSPSLFAATLLGPKARRQGLSAPATSSSLPFNFSLVFGHHHTEPNAFSGPSPDDIVAKAQSSSKGSKSTPKKVPDNQTSVKTLTNGVAKVVIDDSPKTKSKNLDVAAEFAESKPKKAANFVVIGHVDAGKSTLMGRLLYDLKVVDQRTIDKYKKEAETIGKSSFALAWVLDQGLEERSRGVTIDIAQNKFETSSTEFTILDAPGHKDFIPNMIAGASQADFAVLVIDASPNAFESGFKGQTKEHALLVRSMGVQRLIVAINKLDMVAWSKDRFEEVQQQVNAFLLTAGFLPKNVAYIPCSGLTGENVTQAPTSSELKSWFEGSTLLAALEGSEPATRLLGKPLRITIGDVFRSGQQNPLSISGRVEAGSLQVGDRILTQPAGEAGVVRGLEIDSSGVAADWAVAGQNVTVHLAEIDAIHLKSGDMICSITDPIPVVKEFTVKVLAFDFVTPGFVDVLRGRLKFEGRISSLTALLSKSSGTVVKKKPKLVKPAEVARIVVTAVEEGGKGVPIEEGARVVLRTGGETIAAGLVE